MPSTSVFLFCYWKHYFFSLLPIFSLSFSSVFSFISHLLSYFALFRFPLLFPPSLLLSHFSFLFHLQINNAYPLQLHSWAISPEIKAIPPCFWMVLILSSFKGYSQNVLVLPQSGKVAFWVQQDRNRDFLSSAWAESEGVLQIGCCKGSTFVPCSAKGRLSTRKQCYQHRNKRLTYVHRGVLQALQSLFGDLSSQLIFFSSLYLSSFSCISSTFLQPPHLMFNGLHSLTFPQHCWAVLRNLLLQKCKLEGCSGSLPFSITLVASSDSCRFLGSWQMK